MTGLILVIYSTLSWWLLQGEVALGRLGPQASSHAGGILREGLGEVSREGELMEDSRTDTTSAAVGQSWVARVVFRVFD